MLHASAIILYTHTGDLYGPEDVITLAHRQWTALPLTAPLVPTYPLRTPNGYNELDAQFLSVYVNRHEWSLYHPHFGSK